MSKKNRSERLKKKKQWQEKKKVRIEASGFSGEGISARPSLADDVEKGLPPWYRRATPEECAYAVETGRANPGDVVWVHEKFEQDDDFYDWNDDEEEESTP